MKPLLNNLKSYILPGFIIALSFFTLSSLYYPLLNSDYALHTLMLHYFRLPDDLYFWGQDRGGSLIQLLGQVFNKVLGLKPITSESIAHYLLLTAGFIAFASLFRKRFSTLIFAIVWFLPYHRFADSLIHNVYGIQYSLMGIGIYFTRVYLFADRNQVGQKHLFALAGALFAFMLAIWVSDLAVAGILLLLFILVMYFLRKVNFRFSFNEIKTPLAFIVAGALASWLFISFAKGYSTSVEIYSSHLLNNPAAFIQAIAILRDAFREVLLTFDDHYFATIYAYLAIITIGSIIYLRTRIKPLGRPDKWELFFLLDGLMVLAIVMLSHWAYINGLGRRYFTGIYISWWIFFLLQSEHISTRSAKQLIRTLLLLTAITGAISTYAFMKYVNPGHLIPRAKIVSEFENLGPCGIIAEYWNAYISAVSDPSLIKSTPHDQSHVRKPELVDSVFAQPRLFIIKDLWFNTFPDSIHQFNRLLIRSGDPFYMSNSYLCEYKLGKRSQAFNLNALAFIPTLQYFDTSIGQEVIRADEQCSECPYRHMVYGPLIDLQPGNYRVKFFLKADPLAASTSAIAMIDAVADYGQNSLAHRFILPGEFPNNKYCFFELEFEALTNLHNVEFRVLYLASGTLFFDHLTLEEL